MRHWGPEGSARLIDVFHRKATDKVFQEGCWFSGLFLPTGADPQLMLSLLLPGDPPMLCATVGKVHVLTTKPRTPGLSGGVEVTHSHLVLLHQLCPASTESAAVAWQGAVRGLQTSGRLCQHSSLFPLPHAGYNPAERQGEGLCSLHKSDPDHPWPRCSVWSLVS